MTSDRYVHEGGACRSAAGEYIPNNGDVSAHLATERAVTLFEPVRENDYVGYNGGIGARGLDESVLAGYEIIDDAPAPTRGDDGDVCMHQNLDRSEDEPGMRYCSDCGTDFRSPEATDGSSE